MLMHNLGFKTIDYKVESNNSYSEFNISVLIEKKKVGQIVSLNNKTKSDYDIDNNVIICDIDLDKLRLLYDDISISYKQIITYPSISRDIAILVKKNVVHAEIARVIFNASKSILKTVDLFDIYQGKSLGNDIKSMAYSLKFQSDLKTLTVSEVDKEMIKIICFKSIY